jgi:WD40 repeat protein
MDLLQSKSNISRWLLGLGMAISGFTLPAQAGIEVIREWKAAPVLLQNVEFSPNGKQILTASGGGEAQLWTLDGKASSPIMAGQRPPMFNAHFNRNGTLIITTSYNGTVGLWNTQGHLIKTLPVHEAAVADARFVGNQGNFVTSSDDGQVVLRQATGAPSWSGGHPGTARQLVVSPQANLIVASSDSGSVHLIWLDKTGKPTEMSTIKTPHGRINQLSTTADGKTIAASGIDGTVSVWNTKGEMLYQLKATTKGWANGGMFCKTKTGPLLTVGDDGVIKEWTRTGQILAQRKLSDKSRLTKVDCSPSGNQAAVVGSNGELWLLAITSKQ